MAGAVEYGTARRLRANFHELPVFGKTGTCSDKGTRFGWFAAFSDSPQGTWSPSSSWKADAPPSAPERLSLPLLGDIQGIAIARINFVSITQGGIRSSRNRACWLQPCLLCGADRKLAAGQANTWEFLPKFPPSSE